MIRLRNRKPRAEWGVMGSDGLGSQGISRWMPGVLRWASHQARRLLTTWLALLPRATRLVGFLYDHGARSSSEQADPCFHGRERFTLPSAKPSQHRAAKLANRSTRQLVLSQRANSLPIRATLAQRLALSENLLVSATTTAQLLSGRVSRSSTSPRSFHSA